METEMFEQYLPSQRANSYKKYEDRIAVAVHKSGITLIGKANECLASSGYVAIFHNAAEWAMKPVGENESGFKLSDWQKQSPGRENGKHVNCIGFIKAAGLQIKAVYFGKAKDGMIVFSKIPSETI